MSTGVKSGVILKGEAKAINIQKIFSKHFYVSFSKSQSFKGANYAIAFLKATDKFKESFNFSNEVLLLMTTFEVFETRTMDYVDKIFEEFSNRLDKVTVILVSMDAKIEEKIDRNYQDVKETKLVVPFTFEEVLEEKNFEVLLNTKLRKFFYSRDLYGFESPLKTDAYFFGRKNDISTLYDKYFLGEQAGLFGLRKIGKTSLLLALERTVSQRGGLSIFIDCHNPAVHKSRWNELLFVIISKIIEKYDVKLLIDESKYTEKNAAIIFEQDLEKINVSLKKRILLIFDEIEHISFSTSLSSHWSDGEDYIYFWQTLRSVIHTNSDLISFIVAGVNPICVEKHSINGSDNPIFSMIKPTYLKPFNIKEIEEMVGNIGAFMGIQYENPIFTYLLDDYGGHPFLIRHICSQIASTVPAERPYMISAYSYKQNKEEYNSKISEYIDQILYVLEKWYPHEYQMLEDIAIGSEISSIVDFKDQQQFIKHLIGYNVVKEDKGKYFITIEAIEKFLIDKNKYKKLPKTREGKWASVSKFRNRMEDQLRKLLVQQLMAKYSSSVKVKNEILAIKESKQREKLNDLELVDILRNHLFFLDIKGLIIKNWDIFQNMFKDKSKFEIFFDYINSNRIDAHAKDISEEDYALLMISFRWFERILDEVVIDF